MYSPKREPEVHFVTDGRKKLSHVMPMGGDPMTPESATETDLSLNITLKHSKSRSSRKRGGWTQVVGAQDIPPNQPVHRPVHPPRMINQPVQHSHENNMSLNGTRFTQCVEQGGSLFCQNPVAVPADTPGRPIHDRETHSPQTHAIHTAEARNTAARRPDLSSRRLNNKEGFARPETPRVQPPTPNVSNYKPAETGAPQCISAIKNTINSHSRRIKAIEASTKQNRRRDERIVGLERNFENQLRNTSQVQSVLDELQRLYKATDGKVKELNSMSRACHMELKEAIAKGEDTRAQAHHKLGQRINNTSQMSKDTQSRLKQLSAENKTLATKVASLKRKMDEDKAQINRVVTFGMCVGGMWIISSMFRFLAS